MFAYIRGQLITATHTFCVVETSGGIAYKIATTATLLEKLPSVGEKILLHTSFIVREQSQTLYGFYTPEERDAFELLLTVNGIGPKIALCIIGHLPPQQLQVAIIGNDLTLLAKIPGIGKKTAERLVMEMKDKLKELLACEAPTLATLATDSQRLSDAVSALIHLGYTPSTAQKAVKKSQSDLPPDAELATLITHALKHV